MTPATLPRPRPTTTPPWQAPSNAPPAKLLTLVLPRAPGKVLLGLKKRGFGTGFWNGFGGKVEATDASVAAAAARELQEECGLTALDLRRCGTLNFHWEEQPQAWEVAVYNCTQWTGEIVESDEMLPQWTATDSLPFDRMWPDDRHWYPFFLDGTPFEGTFWFRNTTELVQFIIAPTTEEALQIADRKDHRAHLPAVTAR